MRVDLRQPLLLRGRVPPRLLHVHRRLGPQRLHPPLRPRRRTQRPGNFFSILKSHGILTTGCNLLTPQKYLSKICNKFHFFYLPDDQGRLDRAVRHGRGVLPLLLGHHLLLPRKRKVHREAEGRDHLYMTFALKGTPKVDFARDIYTNPVSKSTR